MSNPAAPRRQQATTATGYPAVIVQSIGLGLFAGLFGIVYLGGIEILTENIWPEWASARWFSGGVPAFLIPVVAGLLVGVVYRVFRLPSRFTGFIDELQEGAVEPSTAPGAVGIAVLSLVGGASLGPEAPMGTAGGAAGTWLARRRNGDKHMTRQLSFIGMSGAFGGLMSTPIGGPLLAFELEHDQTHNYYFTNLVPGIIAGAVAFGVMWPVVGAPFKGLLTISHGPFESWMLVAAVAMGLVGVIAALIVGRLLVGVSAALRPLDTRPIVRGLVGGLILGAIGFTLPLTLFSGQTALPVVLDEFGDIGLVTLIALVLLKAVALGVSLGSGFYGGPIFPMFFIGAVLGIVVHLLVPAIPLALAVGCVMASLGAAIALLPLSMAVLVAIMVQSGLEYFAAVVLASTTAYAIRIALTRSGEAGDLERSATAGDE